MTRRMVRPGGVARVRMWMAGAVVVLAGCSGAASGDGDVEAAGGGHGPAGGAVLAEVDPRVCARAQELWVAPDGAGVFVAVVDPTASRAASGLAPAVAVQVLAAQEKALVMQVVRVDGPGAAPQVSAPVVLNPRPGNESVAAREERTVAASCALRQLAAAAAAPATVEGSDVVAAVAAGLAQAPVMMLVDSDGVNIGGHLGVDVTAWDLPGQQFADRARQVHGAVLDAVVPIVWTSLGRTSPPVPGWVGDYLQDQYTSLLPQARITYETAAGASQPGPGRVEGPADELPALPIVVLEPPQAATAPTCVTIPAAVLFAPSSASLSGQAQETLEQVAATVTDQLSGHPGWVVVVGGHTADYGTGDGRHALSVARASTVAEALTRAGTDPAAVSVRGYGATVPADPTRSGPAADAANRRVSVMLGDAAALPTTPTC